MEPRRRAAGAAKKRKTGGAARNGARATGGGRDGSFEQAIQRAVSGGGTVSVGVVNLVKNTLITAISGARDVGGERGTAAVPAGPGSVPAGGRGGAGTGGGPRAS